MQNKEDKNDNIITQSVEISDLLPPLQQPSYGDLRERDESVGATTLSQEDMAKIFKGRNLAFVSTLSSDGSPHITPVWTDIENGTILINTSVVTAKYRHILKNSTIAISAVEQYNPYNMVSIRGKVVEHSTDGADEHLKKLAKKYLGVGKYYYRQPKNKRVILKIRPEKVMGLSLHPAFYFLGYSPWNSAAPQAKDNNRSSS
jgi:PPOX class probable F420-dependent enzyme